MDIKKKIFTYSVVTIRIQIDIHLPRYYQQPCYRESLWLPFMYKGLLSGQGFHKDGQHIKQNPCLHGIKFSLVLLRTNHHHLFLGHTSSENDTLYETSTTKPMFLPRYIFKFMTQRWKKTIFLKDVKVGYSQMAARYNLQHIVKFY